MVLENGEMMWPPPKIEAPAPPPSAEKPAEVAVEVSEPEPEAVPNIFM